jgi:phosphoenolpyruvate carboxylase
LSNQQTPARAARPTALRDVEADLELLGATLDEVCHASGAAETLSLRTRAVELARRARSGDAAAGDELEQLVSELDLDAIELLIRSLTRWFQLINLAEDNERVRRIRAREERQWPAPRSGSIDEVIGGMAQRGISAETVRELLAHAEIRLVMTAHPTEARRRTTIDKQARIFHELRALDERLGRDPEQARERIRATVQELWGSDELRAISPTVLEEVRGGLVYLTSTLVDVVPLVYRDLDRALREAYPGAEIPTPALLRFGSWIGGDRDGNPFVTPETTVQALGLLREQCLRFLEGRLELLAGRLSFSDQIAPPGAELDEILDFGQTHFPALARQLQTLNAQEPYRRAVTFMRERLRATAAAAATAAANAGTGTAAGTASAYLTPAELLADLRSVERALIADGGAYSAAGDLRDVLRQVEVFGFDFATLDIRQHVKAHRAALDEVFGTLRVVTGYAMLAEDERAAFLQNHIADHRPLIPADVAGFSEETQEVIETFRMIRRVLDGGHEGAIDAYVISGTEAPSDVLEALLLMKEAGLSRAGGSAARLRLVPLFEAGATLAAAPDTLATLLEMPVYREALRAVGDHQEIMVGYSDSNKDVGYLASGWGTYRAQVRIAEVLRGHGVSWIFFHGRGGSIGRGGGPTNDAVLALPPGTVEGRLKMTEQGEVLTAKYNVREIAHRELELTTSATLLTSATTLFGPGAEEPPQTARYEQVLAEMAATSEAMYRQLVHDDPDFIEFFLNVTPVEEVSRLRLGSRPARRQAAGGIDDLRAIPWVFAWTQSRILLPAWLGLGTALREARERHGIETLRAMTAEWPFFQTLIANAEMGCSKADPGIARRYIALWHEVPARDRIWGILDAELELTRAELVRVRGGERLLDGEPVLQASIDRRNPYVDPLSFIQIELLKRRRRGADSEELARLSLLAINGIASGLRNTG